MKHWKYYLQNYFVTTMKERNARRVDKFMGEHWRDRIATNRVLWQGINDDKSAVVQFYLLTTWTVMFLEMISVLPWSSLLAVQTNVTWLSTQSACITTDFPLSSGVPADDIGSRMIFGAGLPAAEQRSSSPTDIVSLSGVIVRSRARTV